MTSTYNNRIGQITYPNSSTNTFAYNGLGLRTQKVDSTGTRNYVCDGASAASTVLSDSAAVYSDGSERRGGASSFRHTDALGNTRGITNSSQTATDGILLDAFGMTVSRTGSTPTPFGFVGSEQYQSDPDSGLMLLGHRYYDPSIDRFITSDPAQDGDNWYAYCGNNPLGGVDPEGTEDHPDKPGMVDNHSSVPITVVFDKNIKLDDGTVRRDEYIMVLPPNWGTTPKIDVDWIKKDWGVWHHWLKVFGPSRVWWQRWAWFLCVIRIYDGATGIHPGLGDPVSVIGPAGPLPGGTGTWPPGFGPGTQGPIGQLTTISAEEAKLKGWTVKLD